MKDIDDIDEMDVHATLGRGFLFWAILIIGVSIAGTTLTYCMKPVWFGMEREAAVESHQYVEARKTEIVTNIQKHDELGVRIAQNEGNTKVVEALEMQQRSLKKKIQLAMSKITEDSWPAGARKFK